MFVVYDTETTKIARKFTKAKGWHDAIFKRERDAEKFQQAHQNSANLSFARYEFFQSHIEKTEVRHGIGPCAGKEYVVSVNYPWTCGPWSETYWSS